MVIAVMKKKKKRKLIHMPRLLLELITIKPIFQNLPSIELMIWILLLQVNLKKMPAELISKLQKNKRDHIAKKMTMSLDIGKNGMVLMEPKWRMSRRLEMEDQPSSKLVLSKFQNVLILLLNK